MTHKYIYKIFKYSKHLNKYEYNQNIFAQYRYQCKTTLNIDEKYFFDRIPSLKYQKQLFHSVDFNLIKKR